MDNALKVQRVGSADLLAPELKTEGAAGYDLRADLRDFPDGVAFVTPGLEVEIPTGFAFEIPLGWCGVVLPRGGIGNRGLVLANTAGLIDADYRGEIILTIRATRPMRYDHGDRIAQMVIMPHAAWTVVEVDRLGATARGHGRHGSTGAA